MMSKDEIETQLLDVQGPLWAFTITTDHEITFGHYESACFIARDMDDAFAQARQVLVGEPTSGSRGPGRVTGRIVDNYLAAIMEVSRSEVKRDALQEQVRLLREAVQILGYEAGLAGFETPGVNYEHYSDVARAALAATVPKP